MLQHMDQFFEHFSLGLHALQLQQAPHPTVTAAASASAAGADLTLLPSSSPGHHVGTQLLPTHKLQGRHIPLHPLQGLLGVIDALGLRINLWLAAHVDSKAWTRPAVTAGAALLAASVRQAMGFTAARCCT